MTETDVERVALVSRLTRLYAALAAQTKSYDAEAVREAIAALSQTRDDDLMERAAKVAEGHATCGCNGKHGACAVDDLPNAIASEIRALANQPTSATA